MSPKTRAKKSSTKTGGLTAAERAAMKDRMKELKGGETEGEGAVLAKIAEMSEPDRRMARRIHDLVMASAPGLAPRTWYGMPAYSLDDKVVCFYKSGAKFKQRYATFGFSDKAKLDDGEFWPTDFAVKALTPAVEARIAALVKRAAG